MLVEGRKNPNLAILFGVFVVVASLLLIENFHILVCCLKFSFDGIQ
jgi:hypothetical protein